MAGLTSWYPRDAAWHRRELIVELGEEFQSAAISTMDVLCAWAQEQRAGGLVRNGFRILAREAFVTVSHAQSIVSRAAEIGLLDDLEIDDDGRRFSCRVSGWKADTERGRAALRQAAKRKSEAEPPEHTVTDPNVSRDVTPSALPDIREGVCGARAREPHPDATIAAVVDVLLQCSRLRVERVGVENAIAAWPGRDHVRAARSVVTWASDPTFRQTNAAKLLMDALGKQTPAAVAQTDEKRERTERRMASLRALTGDES